MLFIQQKLLDHHRHHPYSVTILVIVSTIFTIMLSTSSNFIRRPITAAFLWIPQPNNKMMFHGNKKTLSISNQNDDCTIKARERYYLSTRSLSTTALEEKKAINSAEIEATTLAATLCGDAMSTKARAIFGGLQYYNTDIDGRFRVLFVLGGPGSGKGTQSALMEQNYPVAHFSVGELLRNVPEQSPYKATIDAKLVAGQIVPVEISLSLLKEKMEETPSKHSLFLVDGFPRNFDNLSGWCRVMYEVAALEAVLVYQCPFPVLQERILERAKLSGRSDDNIESVKKRFKTFEYETVPVVNVLRSASQSMPLEMQRWNVVDISGDREVDEVWSSTQQILNQLIQSDVLTANAALFSAIQGGDCEAYEKLCDPLFFEQKNVATVMQEQEGEIGIDNIIEMAEIEVISGRQVAISYNRVLGDARIREKRFWCHQGNAGWRNVHFVRTPI